VWLLVLRHRLGVRRRILAQQHPPSFRDVDNLRLHQHQQLMCGTNADLRLVRLVRLLRHDGQASQQPPGVSTCSLRGRNQQEINHYLPRYQSGLNGAVTENRASSCILDEVGRLGARGHALQAIDT
jgi:hypothetical protein